VEKRKKKGKPPFPMEEKKKPYKNPRGETHGKKRLLGTREKKNDRTSGGRLQRLSEGKERGSLLLLVHLNPPRSKKNRGGNHLPRETGKRGVSTF